MTVKLLDQITHQYKSRLVLDEISLSVKPSKILCLMGPSGCGKTTLLNLLAGLVSPTGGKVVQNLSPVSYVFQEPRLFPWETTVENIAIGLKSLGVNQTRRLQRAYNLAERVGLADATHLYPQQLSGGMKQRVNLARAFAINPSLLLLDEPFSSLDLGTRGEAQKLVMNWVVEQETTAILVTHDLAEAVLMADHLVVFSARPARMVYCWENEKPPQQRDAAYIYKILAQLQAVPEVAASFSLETPLSKSL